MNDRFKFRVWDKENEVWVDEEDCSIAPNGELTVLGLDSYGETNFCETNDVIIEQCTGLKDKNGRLIYEGDIIKENNTIHFIRWDNLEGRFRAQTPNKSIDCGIGFDWVDHKEIIGNIHENPERLKG